MKKTKWLFWTSFGLTVAIAFTLFCFHKVAKRVPINYILLFVFGLSSSYMVASITTYQPTINVIIAASLTWSLFLGLTAFAFFVRTSFMKLL